MARPKILVFQHVPNGPLGTLDPLLREAGFRIRYVNFGRNPEERPALDKYAALVDRDAIRAQTVDSIAALESMSKKTFTRWVERFEIPPRRRHLPSR